MKKDSKKLLFIAIVAFIGFLIAFANVFYIYGVLGAINEVLIDFIFPIYYFVLTVVALVMMHGVIITKRPYIVMSILSIALMLIMWIIYIISIVISNIKSIDIIVSELWLPIVLTVLSLIMSICYISLTLDIVKVDKEIKRNKQNNTK